MIEAAERLADRIAGVLGARTRAVILHGSLAAGGFRPGSSDIDLLVVVDGGIDDDQA
ncbi:nucleotidyltransferase domain-containing protein [Actinoplanes sp. NPDC051861]|uniref:nucleotidyltransferase domain-containing protein n=1 Tax=Actinoplanes sp. NPDC051861 TaxID=3155170 RepID=UPI003449C929